MKTSEKPQIIYIAGYGRSGSTLLSLLLNSVPDIVNIGEVNYLYRTNHDELPELWKKLKTETLEALDDDIPQEMAKKRISSIRWCFMKKKLGAKLFKKLWFHPVDSIATEFGVDTLVDASKSTYGSFTRPIYYKKTGYNIKVIHLIRNPHGVMKSYKKGRNVSNSPVLAPAKTGGALRGLLSWFITNTLTSLVYPFHVKRKNIFVLNYDNLIADFDNQMTQLFQFLEIALPPQLLEDEIVLQEDISFSGNRLRLQKTITIRENKVTKGKGIVTFLGSIFNGVYKLIEPRYVIKKN
ncbi:MAG: sulfotransferase [Gilvibacter sp.]